jgi:hypothetical protein
VQAKAVAEAAAAIRQENSKAADIFISGVKGRHSVVNGLYSPTQEKGQDGRVLYRKSDESGDQALCIEHFEGRWRVKNQSDRGSVACFAHVEGCCALERCRSRIWKVSDGKDFVDQPSVQMVTGFMCVQLVQAAAEAKAAAAAAAAILEDNSNATDIFFFGFDGHNSVINGLYSPTQEKGQDGRVLYRKSDEFDIDEELCIDHVEGAWRVTNRWGREDDACLAYCEGCCALEDCRSRIWKVSDGEENWDFVDQPSVQMVTGEEAKSQASGRSVLAPEHTRASPSILSYV